MITDNFFNELTKELDNLRIPYKTLVNGDGDNVLWCPVFPTENASRLPLAWVQQHENGWAHGGFQEEVNLQAYNCHQCLTKIVSFYYENYEKE